MRSSTLYAEIIASFNNPLFDPNHSLLEEVPSNQAHHNIYPPLHSPLFTPSNLPSPSSTITETKNSQLFATPPLTPTQNSQLTDPYPILSIPCYDFLPLITFFSLSHFYFLTSRLLDAVHLFLFILTKHSILLFYSNFFDAAHFCSIFNISKPVIRLCLYRYINLVPKPVIS